jgi:hypothetical protein
MRLHVAGVQHKWAPAGSLSEADTICWHQVPCPFGRRCGGDCLHQGICVQ